jgi:cyanophycinase
MENKPRGDMIIIGGHEDKDGDREILTDVAQRARGGRLVIMTVATQKPEQMAKEYTDIFHKLGVVEVEALDIRTRDEAADEKNLEKIVGARVIFFTGGDQLRITSQIGDSPMFRCMHELYHNGITIVGTSAGAAAMPETMLNGGPSDKSSDISALSMAPGLGFISSVVIDSHFAERGRMGRLLGAVVQNPKNLGIGIDEDTAIVVRRGEAVHVIGSGAVYMVDGAGISYSSLSEQNAEGVISIYDVKLHVLSKGDCFDLADRRPVMAGQERREMKDAQTPIANGRARPRKPEQEAG